MTEDTVTTNADVDETHDGSSGVTDREEDKGRSQVDRELAEELVPGPGRTGWS